MTSTSATRLLRTARRKLLHGALVAVAMAASVACAGWGEARAQEPIRIGFSMALTGGLAGAGKPALIAMEIWRDDTNRKGGLLGRPVQLVYYEDATNPASVPTIYTKLLEVDKVDLVVSGYGTNLIAPAMPIVMRRKLVFPSLFGLAANETFKYDRYFQIMPAGPEPLTDWSVGFPRATGGAPEPAGSGQALTVKHVQIGTDPKILEDVMLKAQRAGAQAMAKAIADGARQRAEMDARFKKFMAELKKRGSAQ